MTASALDAAHNLGYAHGLAIGLVVGVFIGAVLGAFFAALCVAGRPDPDECDDRVLNPTARPLPPVPVPTLSFRPGAFSNDRPRH